MYFGCTGERSGRKGGLEHIHGAQRPAVCAIFQNAFHVAHNVHHVAVTLHGKRLGNFYAANLGNSANIIARQIDQHHVFGAFLRVVDQLLLYRFVLFGIGSTGPGTRQRANGDLLPRRSGPVG